MVIKDTIKINCETKDFIKFEDLTEFQGNLKERTDEDINKIVKSIKKYGFSFPFFVWKQGEINYLLDGHGRYKALEKLDSLGYFFPPLPVVYVDCKDEQSARDLLLRLNSHYGKMTKETVLDFIGDYEIDLSDLELPCGTIDFENNIDIDFGDKKTENKISQLGILIECENETELEQSFLRLKELGYKCKMVE